jgi:hypothetical protein
MFEFRLEGRHFYVEDSASSRLANGFYFGFHNQGAFVTTTTTFVTRRRIHDDDEWCICICICICICDDTVSRVGNKSQAQREIVHIHGVSAVGCGVDGTLMRSRSRMSPLFGDSGVPGTVPGTVRFVQKCTVPGTVPGTYLVVRLAMWYWI